MCVFILGVMMPALANTMTPASAHFRLVFYAAVVSLMRQTVEAIGNFDTVVERFPFLAGYINELAQEELHNVAIDDAPAQWRAKVETFEAAQKEFLPLRALRQRANLSYEDMVTLAGIGMVEDDLRLGTVFEALHGVAGESRPTAGLLASWFVPEEEVSSGLSRMRRLERLGLLVASNPTAPLSGWGVRLVDGLWAVLRDDSEKILPPGLQHRPASAAALISDLVLPSELKQEAMGLAGLLQRGELDLLLLRGPAHNGRRALAAAIAREAGLGVMETQLTRMQNADAARSVCPLAAALGALPLFTATAHPGERLLLPEAWWPQVPLVVVLGREGGIDIPAGLRMASLELPLPDPAARRILWQRALPDATEALRDRMASEARIASGIVFGIATQARVLANAIGRAVVTIDDLYLASRSYGREALDALTTRMPPLAPFRRNIAGAAAVAEGSYLVVEPQTGEALDLLERRCHLRDRLGKAVGVAFGGSVSPGVRALFTGPSGAGKTLAARMLAWRLGKDVYVCNLAAIVSKYIGETEKHMGELFDCATSTDVVLLIDEADALFGKRTEGTHDSTERFGNMQTNFLLQRMDNYEGIVLLTTNLPTAMDPAFRRRMDATIDFHQPASLDRQRIMQAHLPTQHRLSQAFLDDIAMRCTLSGGQIRNIVLHAALLAGDNAMSEHDLYRAVEREYRQMGGLCPLQEISAVV
jgi:hypothetical protein